MQSSYFLTCPYKSWRKDEGQEPFEYLNNAASGNNAELAGEGDVAVGREIGRGLNHKVTFTEQIFLLVSTKLSYLIIIVLAHPNILVMYNWIIIDFDQFTNVNLMQFNVVSMLYGTSQ